MRGLVAQARAPVGLIMVSRGSARSALFRFHGRYPARWHACTARSVASWRSPTCRDAVAGVVGLTCAHQQWQQTPSVLQAEQPGQDAGQADLIVLLAAAVEPGGLTAR